MSQGLFSPLQIRSVQFRNRTAVSPMCEYSGEDGFANDWHFVHLASRAVGGAALVMAEATAVEQRGRISLADLGLWKDEHIDPLKRIAAFVKHHGATPGIQIGHAGRKASTDVPWRGGKALTEAGGGWQPVAPSPLPFSPGHWIPRELLQDEIQEIVRAFAATARRANAAGFEVLEIHGAHGYLINEFLSPLSNIRTDEYGGSYENRTRFAREVIQAVRTEWPAHLPLFMRISATDWVEGGWSTGDSVAFARTARALGVDLIDCSSGGSSPAQQIPVGPGFQVQFAERIRREAEILTGAVGLITKPDQADEIIRNGQADLVFLAREFLRDPYWAVHAAHALGAEAPVPVQYVRAYVDPGGRGSR